MKRIALIALITGILFVSCDNGNGSTSLITGAVPIEISTLGQLNAISASAESLSKSYKLTADITGVTAPIGFASGVMVGTFTGSFDGNGHTVTMSITNGPTIPHIGTFAGLFAVLGEMSGNPGTHGLVHELTVAGTISITGGAEDVFAGGVAGVITAAAAVNNVVSSVSVTATGSEDVNAGGVAGFSDGSISNVIATGAISATSSGHVNAGGVTGSSEGSISNVIATGDISATTSGYGKSAYAGGIAGGIGHPGSLIYAYATGAISAAGDGAADPECIVAGGIAGAAMTDDPDRGTTGAPVKYTVALNSSITSSGDNSNKCSCRIASTSTGFVKTDGASNYGKANLIPTASGSGGTLYVGGNDSNGAGGVDVTVTGGPPAAYTAPAEAWWTNTAWSGADWTTVWEWDSTKGLPVLRFAD
jgi:hypothetical protein